MIELALLSSHLNFSWPVALQAERSEGIHVRADVRFGTFNVTVDSMVASKDRRWLRESLQELLLPALERYEFVALPLDGEDAQSAELRANFPFGRHHRRSEQGIEMIEVQLDKSGRAAFRLNSGIGPLEGVRDQFGYFAPGKLWVHYLDEYCETYRSPAFRRWFAARRNWFGTSTSKEDYRNLVKNHLYVVDELEGFFRSGKLGRHMRRIKK